jgi:hypothetical protein
MDSCDRAEKVVVVWTKATALLLEGTIDRCAAELVNAEAPPTKATATNAAAVAIFILPVIIMVLILNIDFVCRLHQIAASGDIFLHQAIIIQIIGPCFDFQLAQMMTVQTDRQTPWPSSRSTYVRQS